MEALRSDSLEAQKENVDAVFVGGGKSTLGTKGAKRSFADAFTAGGTRKGLLTPSAKRSALSVHSDGKPARKGLKDSAKKTRRVLGDISNRHVNRREGSDPGEGVAAKKKSTAVIKTPMGKAKTPTDTPKTREATPLKATPVAKTLEAVKPTSKDHVEEVELPYGGLPSPTLDDKSLRQEMLREIQDNKTPMFFDNFDVTDPLDVWDCKKERDMLETGAAPSEWWGPPPREIEIPAMDNLEDIPPPAEFADDELDPVDGLDSLDEALNVDLDAAASD